MQKTTTKIWRKDDAGKWYRKEINGVVLQVGTRPNSEPPVGADTIPTPPSLEDDDVLSLES